MRLLVWDMSTREPLSVSYRSAQSDAIDLPAARPQEVKSHILVE